MWRVVVIILLIYFVGIYRKCFGEIGSVFLMSLCQCNNYLKKIHLEQINQKWPRGKNKETSLIYGKDNFPNFEFESLLFVSL